MHQFGSAFCWILLVLSNSVASNGYSTWMFISNIALSTPIGRHLCDQMPLAPEQKQYCERHPRAMPSIQDGAKLGMKECQYRFRESRWNCSIITQSQGLFAKIIQRGSKEAAFVHAITSAGVTYAVTRACSRGELENCSCDKRKRGPNKSNSFVWGGCSDDIKYGIKFAEDFVDATETDRFDAKASMNRHNNRVGRRAVRKFIKRKCKCHGPTATCPTKTCWDELDSFGNTGQYLKTLYNKADRWTVKQDGSITKSDQEPQKQKPSKDKLVYLESSPNYCVQNQETGSLGTTGRECNNKSGEGSCDYMCCGRGYDTKRVVKVEKCNCKFQWCCEVVCQIFRREVDVHTCKAERNASIPIQPSVISGSSTGGSVSNKVTLVEKKKNRKRKRKKKKNRKPKKKNLKKMSRSKRDVVHDDNDDVNHWHKAEYKTGTHGMHQNHNTLSRSSHLTSDFHRSTLHRRIWLQLKHLLGFT